MRFRPSVLASRESPTVAESISPGRGASSRYSASSHRPIPLLQCMTSLNRESTPGTFRLSLTLDRLLIKSAAGARLDSGESRTAKAECYGAYGVSETTAADSWAAGCVRNEEAT